MESLAENPLDLGVGSSFDQAGLRDANTDIGGINTTGTLWYSYTIQSVTGTQPNNFASLELFNNGTGVLGIGKAFTNFAYSKFGVGGVADLQAADGSGIDLVDTDVHRIVGRIDYVAGGNDTATIWLDPDLGADLDSQTFITAVGDLAFDQVRLRSGNAHPWNFDEIRFATSLREATQLVPEPSTALLLTFGLSVMALRQRRSGMRCSSAGCAIESAA